MVQFDPLLFNIHCNMGWSIEVVTKFALFTTFRCPPNGDNEAGDQNSVQNISNNSSIIIIIDNIDRFMEVRIRKVIRQIFTSITSHVVHG